jgi:hypothetical protein
MATKQGRRVGSIGEIERAGDYCGPITGFTGATEACFFLLPNARDVDAPPGQRSLHHVVFPPHTYRECADGSLEIRASIGAMPFWHGYLDEGHVWREC